MANGGAKSLRRITGCRDIDRAGPQTAESGAPWRGSLESRRRRPEEPP